MRARGNAAGSLLCLCARQEVAAIGVVLVCAWLGWLTTRAFELQARSMHIPLLLPLAVLAGIFSRRREDSGEAPRGQAPNELWNQICSTCHVGHPSESGCDVFGSLWEQVRDGLRLTDAEGRIVAVNQAYCEMAGLRREQLVGQSFVCVYPEAQREHALARYRAELAEGRLRRVVEREWQTPSGRRIWVEAHLSQIELLGQVYVLAAFRDVSDRRLLERELAAKVEQARAFLASTSVGMALTDPEGRIQRANPSLCRMLGIGLDEAAGQAWRDLVQVVAEAEAEAGVEACQEDPGRLRLACRPRRPAGVEQLHVELSPIPQPDGGVAGYALVAIDTSRILRLEQQSRLGLSLDEALLGQIELLAQAEAGKDDWNEPVRSVLRTLGAMFEADRVCWYHYDFDRGLCVRLLEWAAAGIETPPDAPREFPLGLYQEWAAAFASGDWIEIEDVADIEQLDLQAVLERRQVKSILGVPVMSEGRCTGWLALHAVRQKRRFGSEAAQTVAAVARVVAALGKLQRTRWQLEHNRAALETALRDSERLRAEAERASQAKSEFLAAVSHELRTPLNGVLGVLSLLEHSDLPAAERQLVAAAQDSARSLLALLSDLIELARLDSGGLKTARQRCNLLELAEQALAAVAPAAAANRLVLASRFDTWLPEHARIDAARVRQVLLNLLGNAIKFTVEGGVLLHIGLDRDGARQSLLFSVRDTGIGIPRERQERVFERFYQAHRTEGQGAGGVGLGLAICQRLVEMMGGRIGLRSQPGRGSEFFFTIPLDDDALSSAQPRRPLAGRRILLLDDNAFRREALAQQMVEWGAVVGCHPSEDQSADAILVAASWLSAHAGAMERLAEQLQQPSGKIALLAPPTEIASGAEACRRLGAELLVEPLRWRQWLSWMQATLAAPARTAAGRAAKIGGAGRRKPRVLVAEDNAMNRRIVEAMLQKLGCEVELAENGAEALKRCQQDPPDLVLLDLEMPVLDGEQTVRRIRSMGLQELPVLALSAHVLPEEVHRALEAGMHGFLSKPVSLDQLAHALAAWISLRPSDAPETEDSRPPRSS